MERLKSFPSDLVRRKVVSVSSPKAYFSRTAREIPNKIGAATQPCFTPLRMSKGSDVEPSKTTMHFMSSREDLMMLKNLGGRAILGRILNRPSLRTRWKAFARAMKATKGGSCCSLHFSCSCERENTISMVDLLARKQHCHSG